MLYNVTSKMFPFPYTNYGDYGFVFFLKNNLIIESGGFIKFLCRRSVAFFSRAILVFLIKESKKRRRKPPGKLMAKSRSQPVNLPGAWPLINQLRIKSKVHQNITFLCIF